MIESDSLLPKYNTTNHDRENEIGCCNGVDSNDVKMHNDDELEDEDEDGTVATKFAQHSVINRDIASSLWESLSTSGWIRTDTRR